VALQESLEASRVRGEAHLQQLHHLLCKRAKHVAKVRDSFGTTRSRRCQPWTAVIAGRGGGGGGVGGCSAAGGGNQSGCRRCVHAGFPKLVHVHNFKAIAVIVSLVNISIVVVVISIVVVVVVVIAIAVVRVVITARVDVADGGRIITSSSSSSSGGGGAGC